MQFSFGLSRIVARSSFQLSQFFHSSSSINMSSSKTAVVLLAEGAEEMEFVIAADVLRRAGVSVIVAGLTGTGPVKCSREVKIVPDKSLKEVIPNGPYDVVVLPGGLGGSRQLADSAEVGEILKNQEQNDRLIAAICAAPTALKAHKIGVGKKVTSYPAMKCQMEEGNEYIYLEDKVVIDGNLITSRGPGTAFDFSLAIVEKLFDKETASNVAKPMLLTHE